MWWRRSPPWRPKDVGEMRHLRKIEKAFLMRSSAESEANSLSNSCANFSKAGSAGAFPEALVPRGGWRGELGDDMGPRLRFRFQLRLNDYRCGVTDSTWERVPIAAWPSR